MRCGVGHIVAQVGPQIGPCAFSSLAATREWLATDVAKAFMRAYRKTRQYMIDTPANEIASRPRVASVNLRASSTARACSGRPER